MQAHQPQGSDAEASTRTRTRPTLASMRLELPSRCDICSKARSTGKHQTCSRTRQQRKASEWEAIMAEKVAARLAKGRRYAR
jgi:hypothetical protein